MTDFAHLNDYIFLKNFESIHDILEILTDHLLIKIRDCFLLLFPQTISAESRFPTWYNHGLKLLKASP